MGKGYMAGFGPALAKSIDDRQVFVREQTARRSEYLRNVGIPAIQKRDQNVQTDVAKINSAIALGFRPEVASAAYEAGHLDAAIDQVSKASNVRGAVDYFNNIQKLTDEYAAKSKNPEEVAKRAWGIAAKVDADLGTEEGGRAGIFETLFSLNPEAAIDANMAKFSVQGYGEKDVTAAMGSTRNTVGPSGYVYDTLPSSLASGTDKFSQSDYRSTRKLFYKSFADSIKETLTQVGDDYIASREVAPNLDGSSEAATSTVAYLLADGVTYAKAMAAIEDAKRKYLQKPASAGPLVEKDWSNFMDALAILRGEEVDDEEEVVTKAVKPIIPPKAVVQKQAGGFDGTVDTEGQ
jgi:hypothetical protein